MALDKLTIINNGGLSTTSDYRVGVLTATKFVGPIEGAITATDASFTGNVSIAGTLTYEDVTNVDSIGLGTFRNGLQVLTGTATTALVVDGDARVTGILTVGSSSLTLDGTNNLVNVGTALTLGHTQGLQFHTQNLHAAGFEINNVNASGIITASQFVGDGSNLSNTGSTLSEPSTGTQRIVTTSLTSGTMTSSGTGSELAFDYANNELEFSDNTKISLGTDRDLQLSHNTSDSIISHIGSATGNLKILSGGAQSIECVKAGAVKIAHNGTTKIETNTTGAQIDTTLRLYGAAGTGGGRLRLAEGAAYSEIRGVRNTDSSSELWFGTEIGGTVDYRAKINTGGHFIPYGDSIYDLGLTGTRWRNVYADTLYGDGSNLTGITQTSIVNYADNKLVTATGNANTLNAETNLTFNGSNLTVNTNDNQKIILSGTTNPYIRFQENSTNKCLIGWHSAGFFKITNNEDSSELRIKDAIDFTTDGGSTYHTVWHAGNDGPSSGLNADLLDGQQGSYYQNASNLNAGTVNDARLPGTISSNITGNAASLKIVDTRNDGARVPNDYTDHAVTAEFTNQIINGWHTALTVKGWADGYAPWQLVGYSDTQQNTNLRVRFGHGQNNTWSSLYNIWHSGNDGSGSGLDSDTVDGLQASSFLRSDSNDICSARLQFTKNNEANYDTIATTSSSQGAIEIYNNGSGNDAFMAFHTGSDYAFYFGLDADTNDLSVGGWSMGANKYRVWHEGNDGGGSGLNADLLDGHQSTDFVEHNQNSGYILKFGSGGNSGHTSSSYPYAIFQEGGAWSSPYPDLRINYHTGIAIAVGYHGYGGLRFQRDYNDTTELMSIGNGDNHVRIANNLYIGGHRALTVNDAIGNADTVDNIHASSFIRSDTDDSIAKDHQIRFNSGSAINTSTAYEASLEVYSANGNGTDAFMSFHVSGDYALYFGLDGGTNDLAVGGWSKGAASYKVWHEGNDGPGSGLNADYLDGYETNDGASNNTIVRRTASGYIFANYFNTTANDTGNPVDVNRFYCSEDNYIRYIDKISMRAVMNVSARSSAYAGRENNTTDQNYWIGSAGWGADNFDTTVWDYGSCFFDVWGNPSGQPSGTSHWTGFQSMHYTNASNRYGCRIAVGAGNPHNAYIQGRWGTTTNGWYRLWNESNDHLLFSTTHNQTDQLQLKMHTNSWNGGIKFISNDGNNVSQLHMDNSSTYDLMVDSSFYVGGSFRCNGNVIPHSNDNLDLGESGLRWRNIYTTDLQLSNESKKDKGGNDVDGTWGDYTIQEGEDDLFLINNRSGKKYKFMVQEVK